MSHTYEYPRPAFTCDCVIFGYDGSDMKVLLIRRAHAPFAGLWALPGGFVNENEDLQTAALRELEEETGVKDVFVEQLYTVGTPGRDPRGWVVTVAYFALVNLHKHPAAGSDDADRAEWFPMSALPDNFAFDHADILKVAVERLKSKVRYQPLGFELLPEQFTLSQLQNLYESILGLSLNKRNFRTKFLKMNLLKSVERQKEVSHRPAQLYTFDEERYRELSAKGFNFEI